jgi:arginyl-tRNA synthetase
MMSNFIGEFIKNIYKFSSAEVVNLSYPSDKSIGIAKAIYIIKNDGGLEQEIFKKDLSDIIKYLGNTYVRGVAEFKKWEADNNIEKIQEVKNIANNIFGNISGEDFKIFEYAKERNIFYFQNFLQKLNSNFDEFIFESEAGEEGKKTVLENTGEAKVFQKSEGAIIYNPGEEKKDIPTLVYINSEGNPTYGAKDIGLLNLKFKKYNPDLSIYIVDNEQNVHFKSVFDAMSKINKNYAEKSLHTAHGRMTFKGARMSSRLGGVPTGEEILSAVIDEVREKSSEKVSHMNEIEKEDLYRNIALASLKISILRSKAGVNIDFDPERATSFEGDSGPYLCYTYARCCSLLEKGKFGQIIPSNFSSKNLPPLLVESEFPIILRKAFQYNSILETVVNELASQKLVTYLFELAAEFNKFYAENKIIDEENKEETENKLFIVKVVSDILKHGLSLLGIKAPEKM